MLIYRNVNKYASKVFYVFLFCFILVKYAELSQSRFSFMAHYVRDWLAQASFLFHLVFPHGSQSPHPQASALMYLMYFLAILVICMCFYRFIHNEPLLQ